MARGRVVSKSISDSEKVEALSCDSARLLFTWLIPHQDNLCRLRGEPKFIQAVVVPRRDYTLEQIEAWLTEMAELGLITWYVHQGTRFVHIENSAKHNLLHGNMSRASEFPGPDDEGCTPFVGVRTPRGNGLGLGLGSGSGLGGTEHAPKSTPPTPPASSATPSPAVIELPTNVSGQTYPVTQAEVAEWTAAYPAVDVPTSLRRMRVWLDARPKRRKTLRGMPAFITTWLGRDQDRPAPANGADASDDDDPYGGEAAIRHTQEAMRKSREDAEARRKEFGS